MIPQLVAADRDNTPIVQDLVRSAMPCTGSANGVCALRVSVGVGGPVAMLTHQINPNQPGEDDRPPSLPARPNIADPHTEVLNLLDSRKRRGIWQSPQTVETLIDVIL